MRFAELIPVLQMAVGPVILISGIGLILLSMTNRFGRVIDRAVQVHGALGVTEDTPLEKMYRDARYARLYDGPDEVHRMVVARRILKAFEAGEGWRFA